MIALDSLRELLDEMRSMIERIDDESYAAPVQGRPGSGIGGHVRHCLEHVLTRQPPSLSFAPLSAVSLIRLRAKPRWLLGGRL